MGPARIELATPRLEIRYGGLRRIEDQGKKTTLSTVSAGFVVWLLVVDRSGFGLGCSQNVPTFDFADVIY